METHVRRLENFEISKGADLPQDPVISFGPEDLRRIVAPHNDALVVTATIANYDMARIFIDNGSSGRDSRWVTKMITFTMVDTPSSYNGILGRPALKDFRAVASMYHQKLKFPVGKEVGVLCGDQKVARRYYVGIAKEEGSCGGQYD
ncbi:uncharacterized protein LOC142520319 [Primulina tabacum]|uniref:uncharacterized protein LOC142520319 n=1 Tax=Primulina tabacum TaxID=48773 RepID=UPI003F59782E